MPKFPVDAPKERVNGSYMPLTMLNHRYVKGSTLRSILTQAGIPRDDFLDAYEETK